MENPTAWVYSLPTMKNEMNKNENQYGMLHDYKTGEVIRPATEHESELSREAQKENIGGGSGVFSVEGRSVYVE